MSIILEIDESKLKGFSKRAIANVKLACDEYISVLTRDIYHLEQNRRHQNLKDPEVTETIVEDAKLLMKMGIPTKRARLSVKIFRIITLISTAAASKIFDKDKLHDQYYLYILVPVIVVAITSLTLSILKE